MELNPKRIYTSMAGTLETVIYSIFFKLAAEYEKSAYSAFPGGSLDTGKCCINKELAKYAPLRFSL